MNVEIGTETPIFLFWEYLFQIFGILSLQCIAREPGKRVKDEQERSYLCCVEVHITDGEALGGWLGSPTVLRSRGGAGSALSPAGGWVGSSTVLRCRGGAGSALSPAAPKGRFQDRQHRPAQYSGRLGLIESRDCSGNRISCFTFFSKVLDKHTALSPRSHRRKHTCIPLLPPPPDLCPKTCLLVS